MGKASVDKILDQVRTRYDTAKDLWTRGYFDKAEEELSTLRDVLDDIYDRPEEKISIIKACKVLEDLAESGDFLL